MIKEAFKQLLISIIKSILYIQMITRINKKYNPKKIKNILIYTSMGIGDILLFSPTMKALRKYFSSATITLLINRNKSQEELLKESGLVNKIILFERGSSFSKKIQFLKKLRKSHFDLLINGFWTDDIYLVLIGIVCNIPFRVGYCSSDEWKSNYDFLYNIKIRFGNEHEIDRGLRFTSALGINKSYIEKKPVFYLEEKNDLFVQTFFIENNLNSNDLIIGIHPGTALHQKWKRWNIKKFSELCERVVRYDNAKIIIFGSKEEAKLAEYIKERVQRNIIIATGKTTIKEAAALIKRCNLFICNDSGLMHISAAVNIPVIAIYGPTDPCRTSPIGDSHIIIKNDLSCSPCFKPGNSGIVENCPNRYECLNSINVDEVFKIIVKKIEQIKGINQK